MASGTTAVPVKPRDSLRHSPGHLHTSLRRGRGLGGVSGCVCAAAPGAGLPVIAGYLAAQAAGRRPHLAANVIPGYSGLGFIQVLLLCNFLILK